MGNKTERKLDKLEKIQWLTSRFGISVVIGASLIGSLTEVLVMTGGVTAINSGIEFLIQKEKAGEL